MNTGSSGNIIEKKTASHFRKFPDSVMHFIKRHGP